MFDESQVFRIDHYLGKETVQNLMALRFANALFEPVWNRNFIDYVQITAAEDIGIGGRAGYYEGAGALRDLVQNHMMQLLALLTMEPPTAFDADRVRDEKLKVLEAIVPPAVSEVPSMAVRGAVRPRDGRREARGRLPRRGGRGPRLSDRDVRRAAPARVELALGRRAVLPAHRQAAGAQDHRDRRDAQAGAAPRLPEQRLGRRPGQSDHPHPPARRGRVGLAGAKIPGAQMRIRPVNMEFRYGTSFMSESPEAYERLILDAMRGDATLFTRGDEIEALWAIIDPILTAWHDDTTTPIPQYPAGSAGPAEADALVEGDGRWRRL